MSSFYRLSELPRIVVRSINDQPHRDNVDDKTCGCHQRGETIDDWWLCQYHIGMTDGFEALIALLKSGGGPYDMTIDETHADYWGPDDDPR